MFSVLSKENIIYPEILSYDLNKKEVTYRYCEGINLKVLYGASLLKNNVDEKILSILNEVAKALSIMHQNKGDTNNIIDITGFSSFNKNDNQKNSKLPIVLTHGDFTLGNIIVNRGQVIILDANSNSYLNTNNGSSTIYYDLGQLIASLDCIFPLRYHILQKKNVRKIYVSKFIEYYESLSGQELDHSLLNNYILVHLRAYASLKKKEKHITSIIWDYILKKKISGVTHKNG
jgi:hypothetical protein